MAKPVTLRNQRGHEVTTTVAAEVEKLKSHGYTVKRGPKPATKTTK